MIKQILAIMLALLFVGTASVHAKEKVFEKTSGKDFPSLYSALKTNGWITADGQMARDGIGAGSLTGLSSRQLKRVPKEQLTPQLFGAMIFLKYSLIDGNGFILESISPDKFKEIGQSKKGWVVPTGRSLVAALASTKTYLDESSKRKNAMKMSQDIVGLKSKQTNLEQATNERISKENKNLKAWVIAELDKRDSKITGVIKSVRADVVALDKAQEIVNQGNVLWKENAQKQIDATSSQSSLNAQSIIANEKQISDVASEVTELGLPFGYYALERMGADEKSLETYSTYRNLFYAVCFVLMVCIIILMMDLLKGLFGRLFVRSKKNPVDKNKVQDNSLENVSTIDSVPQEDIGGHKVAA